MPPRVKMTKKWYEMTESEIRGDAEALQERHLAYFSTFCSKPEGRQVLCHLKREAFLFSPPDELNADEALVRVSLGHFVNKIRRNCGVTDEMAVVEAEAEIAKNAELEETPKVDTGLYPDVD